MRRALQVSLEWCGRPTQVDLVPMCLLLERIAMAVGGAGASVEKIAELLASLVGAIRSPDQGHPTHASVPAMMTVEQVALRLQVSPGFAYEAIADGRLKHHRFGKAQGGIRVSEGQLLEFLRQTERGGSGVEPQSHLDRKPARPNSFKFLPPPS